MLILDPYLFGSAHDLEGSIAFLGRLARPIRALTRSVTTEAQDALLSAPGIDARQLPDGKQSLHDRVWIVGETGLLVGTSLNALAGPGGARTRRARATTLTELPHADVAMWRGQFEAWWART